MLSYVGFLAVAGIVIILYDGIASLVSKRQGIDYSKFVVGSNIIYALVGGTAGALFAWSAGIAAAAFTGLVEATIGWSVSWQIGAGRVDAAYLTASNVTKTIVFVTMMAAVIGGVASIAIDLALSG